MEKNIVARQDRKPNVRELLNRTEQPVFKDPMAEVGLAELIVLHAYTRDFKRASTERYWDPSFAVCPENAFGLNGLEASALRGLGRNVFCCADLLLRVCK